MAKTTVTGNLTGAGQHLDIPIQGSYDVAITITGGAGTVLDVLTSLGGATLAADSVKASDNSTSTQISAAGTYHLVSPAGKTTLRLSVNTYGASAAVSAIVAVALSEAQVLNQVEKDGVLQTSGSVTLGSAAQTDLDAINASTATDHADLATLHADETALLKSVGLVTATVTDSGGPVAVAAANTTLLAAATRARVFVQNVGTTNDLLLSSANATGTNYFAILGPRQSVEMFGAEASTQISAWSVGGTNATWRASA